MSNGSKVASIPDCKVCYVPHDEEIHEATLRVRRWLNYEITRKLSNGFETGQELEDPSLASHVA
jgi:Zn-finger protein